MDYVGITERHVPVEEVSGESSNAGTRTGTSSGSSSGQLTTIPKLSQNKSLALYLTKLFDEKIPFRKKVFNLSTFSSLIISFCNL